jgi:phage gpG-like protein
MTNLQGVIKRIISDIRVDLSDEFDQNFQRQGFFSERWKRRRNSDKTLLIGTGNLRRSIKSRESEDGVTFYSDEVYAGIHNEGGEIKVTAKMKKYFWYKYAETQGGFGRKKSGELRKDKRNERLTTESEFYKAMALMKVGSTIKIPKRQFLGSGTEVESIVRSIIEDNLSEYFNNEFEIS